MACLRVGKLSRECLVAYLLGGTPAPNLVLITLGYLPGLSCSSMYPGIHTRIFTLLFVFGDVRGYSYSDMYPGIHTRGYPRYSYPGIHARVCTRVIILGNNVPECPQYIYPTKDALG